MDSLSPVTPPEMGGPLADEIPYDESQAWIDDVPGFDHPENDQTGPVNLLENQPQPTAADNPQETGSAESAGDPLRPLNLWRAFREHPPTLDFVMPGFLLGTVGTLFSPGATGKSFWTLEAAMAVAGNGLPGTNPLQLEITTFGKVAYIAAEDPGIVLWHRLQSIGKTLPDEAVFALMKNLSIIPALGKGINIGEKDWQKKIIATFQKENIRLIVLDTLSRVHRLDENSNGEMAGLMQDMEVIARHTKASILFLHHISKASAATGTGDTQQASRGASVLTDNARWGSSLVKMSEKEAEKWCDDDLAGFSKKAIGNDNRGRYIRLSVNKNNYGQPIEDEWYRREDGGVLARAKLVAARSEEKELPPGMKYKYSTDDKGKTHKRLVKDDSFTNEDGSNKVTF